jgi:hypothetical protein
MADKPYQDLDELDRKLKNEQPFAKMIAKLNSAREGESSSQELMRDKTDAYDSRVNAQSDGEVINLDRDFLLNQLDGRRVPQEEVNKMFSKGREEVKKYNKDLRARAKPESELYRVVECMIIGPVIEDNYSVTIRGENVLGGHSRTYDAGIKTVSSIPVNKEGIGNILYNGSTALELGDRIRAKIFVGEKEYEKTGILAVESGNNGRPFHYLERNFKSQESPVTIEKIVKGNVVKVYRARDLDK